MNCNLEHHSIRELVGSHSYDAISYVWGSSSRTTKVLCDNYTSHLYVTANLRNVLEKLASEPSGSTGRLPYWIDGLCINQEDEQERGHQVRKMANIYRRAACVHIFLGTFGIEQNLLQTQWLTRRWVIQEAVAAQKAVVHFQMGGQWRQAAWADFVGIASNPTGLAEVNMTLFPAAGLLRGLSETKKTRWSGIFPLLLKFHSAECHDDRDRLFALLGVSSDVELRDEPGSGAPAYMAQFQALKIWFQPDYTLDTAQVYQKFALAALRSPLAFDLLHCAGAFRLIKIRSPSRHALSTWVPDWRCPPLFKPLIRPAGCHAGMLKSVDRQKANKQAAFIAKSERWITVRGILLGTVQRMSNHLSEIDTIPHSHHVKVEWSSEEIDLGIDRAYVVLDSGHEVFVPVDVRLGDKVVILIGARTPFMLRDTGDTSRVLHELIGDCYVFGEGIMNGRHVNQAAAEAFVEFHIE
jgi:hypothetical protein